MGNWRRQFFHTRTSVTSTWKFRVVTVIVLILMPTMTRGFWAPRLAGSLVCTGAPLPSDIMLVENFDSKYLVFERAAELEKMGFAPRALVPVPASNDPAIANPVFKGIAELMARQARMGTWEILPIQETEPISLNVAYQIRDQLAREHIRSMLIVTPGFRSRRTSLVYQSVLRDVGTQVSCVPVFGRADPEHWTDTWHSIQDVTQEFLKLQYYRFYVMPFLFRGIGPG